MCLINCLHGWRLNALVLLVLFFAGCASQPGSNDSAVTSDNRQASPDAASTAGGPENQGTKPEAGENLTLSGIKALIEEKKFARAEASLRLYVLKHPQSAVAWANLGIVLTETDNLDGAEKALKKSVELDPGLAAAYLRLGSIYRKQGKIPEALSMNNKALDIFPGYANAHYNIAILYDLYLQDPEKALKHLNQYLQLTNSNDKRDISWQKQLERSVGADKSGNQTGNASSAVSVTLVASK